MYADPRRVQGCSVTGNLRVTLVFRRDDSDWRLVHRHADALVHPITMEQLSLLARGSVEPSRPATPRGEL
jgi:hypothetical protein